MDKYLLLMCDPKSGKWHINVQTEDQEFARDEFDKLKDRDTPSVLIFTGDFVTV